MRRAVLSLVLAAVPAVVWAATLTPSTILANTAGYDGKSVIVTGKVTGFQTSQTTMGTVAGFRLCDSDCVLVIDEKGQSRTDGDTATVTGTFHITFKGPKRSFSNAVVISK